MRPTKAIIHLDNLQHNIAQIKKKLKDNVKICLPVKADAYGHGAVRSAIAAIRAGVTHLAVASVQEGVELREAGIVAPIISLSLPSLEEIESIIENNIHPLVVDEEFIYCLNSAAFNMKKIAHVHLKIDTGMGRIGCTPDEAVKLAAQIKAAKNLVLDGVCTHFAVSDSQKEEDSVFTKNQISIFKKTICNLENAGINCGIVHAANSGAVLLYPETQFDMVRAGLLAYGYTPTKKLAEKIDLKPVMELITQIVSIKKINKGTSVSYDRLWTASKDTYIATLPIGYADGLMRALSGNLNVRIGENFYPIVGRICMDQCMVDIGSAPCVHRWDKVCIFGPSTASDRNNSARDLGLHVNTIPYEITSNINKRVPRVYIDEVVT